MCVIIVKQHPGKLPNGVAKNSAKINPHGLGIVWLDTYEITYHKSAEFKKLETERPFIAHFRFATVGEIGRSNTHPFKCGNNTNEYLMMNGTIFGMGNRKDCDSKILANNMGSVPRHRWSKELSKHSCRFVTVNTNTRTFQIYNKELWTKKEGVWYSKDNILDDNIVAVYGTLKKGYNNYWSYLNNCKYIGRGQTKDKYPLIIRGLPYMIDDINKGHNVEVDVFAVSDSKLKDLDRLEGHPNWYRRKQIPIKLGDKIITCWIYFNIKETIDDNSLLHKKYTQEYKPTKMWWDYERFETQPKKVDRYPYEFEEFAGVDDIDEFDVRNEKPICVSCYHDLEHDAFANYHCSACGSWYTEAEVLQY